MGNPPCDQLFHVPFFCPSVGMLRQSCVHAALAVAACAASLDAVRCLQHVLEGSFHTEGGCMEAQPDCRLLYKHAARLAKQIASQNKTLAGLQVGPANLCFFCHACKIWLMRSTAQNKWVPCKKAVVAIAYQI